MTKYHTNAEGNSGRCSADEETCPLGGKNEHFTSKRKARKARETLTPCLREVK